MPDPNPDWFFQPRRQAAAPAEDAGAGLISLPAEVLQRHGARVLSPDTAVSAHIRYPAVASTFASAS